jgi:hypothetical protein
MTTFADRFYIRYVFSGAGTVSVYEEGCREKFCTIFRLSCRFSIQINILAFFPGKWSEIEFSFFSSDPLNRGTVSSSSSGMW